MSSRRDQQTLCRELSFRGVGLHTGSETRVWLSPLPPASGVRFRSRGETFPADLSHVVSSDRCTTLGAGSVRVQTVEHLLSALAGCSIDNCLVDVEGPEIPILDGSARDYVEAIRAVGAASQNCPSEPLAVTRPVWVQQGDSHLLALPAASYEVTCGIEFASDPPGRQLIDLAITTACYNTEVAAARTFGFLSEVEELRQRGLAHGGSLENAVVIDDIRQTGYLNEVRFPDEPVRHKLLDLLGDLALLGRPLLARVIGLKTSHSLNIRLARALLERNANVLEA